MVADNFMGPAIQTAKVQLACQARHLEDAQQRVDELLRVQQKLKAVLVNGASATSSTAVVVSEAPAIGNGQDTKKVTELRKLLGDAVRTQAKQQSEIESLRELLREEQTAARNALESARIAETKSGELQEQVDELQRQLQTEQQDRMESEAAALEREEKLEEKVEELEEKERRRIALEAAMEEAMAKEAPPTKAVVPEVAVAVSASPAKPAEGFDAAAGGFSL
eukprot:CAMPEP_0115857744 /NCGR_PEP_ID=MMETSP0287-20121206/15737_1 /TAXON_ID=412157 /ORGANISM="Chrysochromulina rotalis, Strain UIO044" /LENGTH=222 /DNA_ID=CAMNT_0003311981 /DNA_START=27 /DNA_END=695 /DNA_ORIENTATION=+